MTDSFQDFQATLSSPVPLSEEDSQQPLLQSMQLEEDQQATQSYLSPCSSPVPVSTPTPAPSPRTFSSPFLLDLSAPRSTFDAYFQPSLSDIQFRPASLLDLDPLRGVYVYNPPINWFYLILEELKKRHPEHLIWCSASSANGKRPFLFKFGLKSGTTADYSTEELHPPFLLTQPELISNDNDDQ